MSTTADATKEKKPTAAATDDVPLPIPNLVLPQLVFILNEPKAESKREGVLEKLLQLIEQDGTSQSLLSLDDFLSRSLRLSFQLCRDGTLPFSPPIDKCYPFDVRNSITPENSTGEE
jgi:hypothetical protein